MGQSSGGAQVGARQLAELGRVPTSRKLLRKSCRNSRYGPLGRFGLPPAPSLVPQRLQTVG